MAISISTAAVCFIACHGGPADHFATYAEAFTKAGFAVQIYAGDAALTKFRDRGIEVKYSFSIGQQQHENQLLADQIAKACSAASLVITDVGAAFDVTLQKALAQHAPTAQRWAYYDNPEPCVPGGYSSTAADVIQIAQGVLFANENLATTAIYRQEGQEIEFGDKKRIGIGYYPIGQADQIAKRRDQEQKTIRAQFFTKQGLQDTQQKVLIYFGGNNKVYFEEAFPAFLHFVSESMKLPENNLTNLVIVVHQHPGAKAQNLDKLQVEAWLKEYGENPKAPKVVLSDLSSDNAQVLADAALYYQTSMGPQFALAGIPTIQVGHKKYEDILVRNSLNHTATSAAELIAAIAAANTSSKQESQRELIFKGLGIRSDWFNVLEKVVKEALPIATSSSDSN